MSLLDKVDIFNDIRVSCIFEISPTLIVNQEEFTKVSIRNDFIDFYIDRGGCCEMAACVCNQFIDDRRRIVPNDDLVRRERENFLSRNELHAKHRR